MKLFKWADFIFSISAVWAEHSTVVWRWDPDECEEAKRTTETWMHSLKQAYFVVAPLKELILINVIFIKFDR